MTINPGTQFGGELPDNVNEALFDALIRHQIGLLRLSGSVRNRVLKILDEVERDMRLEIEDRLSRGTITAQRQKLLLKQIRSIRGGAWDRAIDVWMEEMFALAKAEPAFVAAAVASIAPVELDMVLPSASQLRAIVTTFPFEGRTMREWARDIRRADLARIDQQIKMGIVQGETPRQIASRINGTTLGRGRDGATQITRNGAAAITRTAVNAISNAAKREFYTANADLFEEEMYVATLDERTTRVCSSLDGTMHPVGKGPIPPLHFNCRSLRVPIIRGEVLGRRPAKPVTTRQLLRQYTRENGLASVTSRADLPRGHKGAFDDFSRTRIRGMTGQVDAKITYQDWLGRQSAEFQDDVLGPTRGKLFRDGDLPLRKFVNRSGDELTLAQLARADADAFTRAGLNPEDFL
jgi:SPP1 gp7 family putative phage head morphogenesis protein